MASSYVNNLRLNELATGDASGTWGTVTNLNLELIGEALGFGTRAIANASTDNITIADGASDSDRAMYLKLTGGGQACTVTLLPNTVSKLWFMENGTNSALTFTQGSGANVIIPAGDTKLIASNGGGSGAIVYDVFASLSVVDLKVQDDLTVNDDILLNSDSSAIKFGAGADATLTHTNDVGLTLNSTNKLMFNDASQFIQGSSATVLSIGATNEIDLTATAIDVNGTMDVSGAFTNGSTLVSTGKITADAGIDIDNINIDGTTIALSSGDLTIDVEGTIILDGDEAGATVHFKDGGTHWGSIYRSDSNFNIESETSDKDIIFKGNDGGSVITALTLDMSEAGAATFNDKITAVGTSVFTSLDISGNIDVDGTTNLDAVDIDGAVQLGASDDDIRMTLTGNNQYRLTLVNGTAASVILGSGGANNFRISNSGGATIFEIDDNKDIILPGTGAGIHLGVTSATASNLLDDYEEGTWTPDVANDNSSDNFSTRIGKYTKIGQQVVVNFICDGGNSGTAGTQLRLSGLPFAVENGSSAMMIGSILANGGNNNNGGIISDGRLMDGGNGQTNQVTFITAMLSYRTTA